MIFLQKKHFYIVGTPVVYELQRSESFHVQLNYSVMKTVRNSLSLLMLVMVLSGIGTDLQAQGRGRGNGYDNPGRGNDKENHPGKGHDKDRDYRDDDRDRYDRDDRDRDHHYYSSRHDHHDNYRDRHVTYHHHRNGPPSWAPAYGYRYNTRYMYYRDYNVYYDCHRNVFITWTGRNWMISTRVPDVMCHVDFRRAVVTGVDYWDDDFDFYLERRRPLYVSIHASW